MKRCVFITVFKNPQYLCMLYLLLESLYLFGELNNEIDILIYTSSQFKQMIIESKWNSDRLVFETTENINTVTKACCARLNLFTLSSVTKYEKILYLDTDIIVTGSLTKLFDISEENILYTVKEGFITDQFHGGYSKIKEWATLFNNNDYLYYKNRSAFTTGILLFNNCPAIVKLFQCILKQIQGRSVIDQPFIIYNAFKYNLYNNTLLQNVAVNLYYLHYSTDFEKFAIDEQVNSSSKVIYHFPNLSHVNTKLNTMSKFLNQIKDNYICKLGHTVPNKNTTFPIVAYCVSYNYMDTLQFMLPINYMHFEHIYLITQVDDVPTIEFCKQFSNVTVLFWNFKSNGKSFDKFGAINHAYQHMYKEYPNHWYLGIDSDILLPTNFINILEREHLHESCLYGGFRHIAEKISDINVLQKILNIGHVLNNILHNATLPPSVLGSFQLHKKQCYNKVAAVQGKGDYEFGYQNFNLFCNLQNLHYIHLGPINVNWFGKVKDFIIDTNDITLEQMYYSYDIENKNVYYNKKREKVQVQEDGGILICAAASVTAVEPTIAGIKQQPKGKPAAATSRHFVLNSMPAFHKRHSTLAGIKQQPKVKLAAAATRHFILKSKSVYINSKNDNFGPTWLPNARKRNKNKLPHFLKMFH